MTPAQQLEQARLTYASRRRERVTARARFLEAAEALEETETRLYEATEAVRGGDDARGEGAASPKAIGSRHRATTTSTRPPRFSGLTGSRPRQGG